MKSLSLITACALLAVSSMAQGTINFLNRDTSAGINAPIFDVDGSTKLEGAAFKAQLYGGAEGTAEASLAPVGDIVNFRTGAAAGYWDNAAPLRTIPGVTPGSAATVQVYVWESQYNSLAEAQAAFGKFGKSTVFTVPKTGGVTDPTKPPALPEPFLGITSFNMQVIPEPSTIALGLLGAAALMFRRRK